MDNSIEIKDDHIENEIYSLLITWLIFEIDKKDKKNGGVRQNLQLVENLSQIDAPRQIKNTVFELFKQYDFVNPRIAFELTKVLSLARIKRETEFSVVLQQVLNQVFSIKDDAKSFERPTKNMLESALKKGLLNDIEYKTVNNTRQIINDYVHGLNTESKATQVFSLFNLVTLIKIILKIDHQNQPKIFSIGYGNRSKEDFLSCIEKYNIKCIIDVRSKPFSKFNPDFNGANLESILISNEIEYEFFGEYLGGRPEDASSYLENGKVDYAVVRNKAFFRKGIELLKERFAKKGRIALMCSELKPEDCHRSKLIGEFLTNHAQLPITHINEHGELKSQKEVMTLVMKGVNSNSLFGESLLTSRKKYN